MGFASCNVRGCFDHALSLLAIAACLPSSWNVSRIGVQRVYGEERRSIAVDALAILTPLKLRRASRCPSPVTMTSARPSSAALSMRSSGVFKRLTLDSGSTITAMLVTKRKNLVASSAVAYFLILFSPTTLENSSIKCLEIMRVCWPAIILSMILRGFPSLMRADTSTFVSRRILN